MAEQVVETKQTDEKQDIIEVTPCTHVKDDAIKSLKNILSKNARLLQPWDDEYMKVSDLWNGAFDCVTPSFILMAQTEYDVVNSVNFCSNNGLIITPRAGRHNLGGYSTVENGFVVDFREMKNISVNLEQETVTIQCGIKSGMLEEYLWQNAKGYCIMGIMDPNIGITGAYLGVGHGFLQRLLSTGTDNIIELKVVLASGKLVICNKDKNNDLFYGIRGTHSNMGIVVSLTIKLHKILDTQQRKECYHSFFYVDIKYGKEMFDNLNHILDDKNCPNSLLIVNEIIKEENKWVSRTTWSHYVLFDDFKHENMRIVEAEKWSKGIKELVSKYGGKYIVPFEWVTHFDHQTKFVSLPSRLTWYTSGGFVSDKNKDIVYDKLYKNFTSAPKECNACEIFLMAYGGKLNERDSNKMGCACNPAGKGIKWLVMYWSLYENKGNNDINGEIVREFTRDSFYGIKPYLEYGYVNGIAYDQNSDDFVRFVYGQRNYKKLKEIKQKYDPTNLFRNNLNIIPKNYYKFNLKQKNIVYKKPN